MKVAKTEFNYLFNKREIEHSYKKQKEKTDIDFSELFECELEKLKEKEKCE